MDKGINVVSTFDGMGCLYIALKELKIKVNKYFAIEVDKHAIKQTKHNFPDIIHLGDITKVTKKDFQGLPIHILAGGSPCQGFSFAGKQLNFSDPRSALFFEFIRLKNELKPKYFLLENVNMKKEYLRVISEYLGIFPVRINSNFLSAQNRDRWYWSDIKTIETGLFSELWTGIPQPEDRGILLKDILQPESEVDKKYYLSNSVTVNLLKHKENQKLKGNGFGVKLHKGNDKFNALKVGGSGVDDIYCVAMRGRNPENPSDRKTGSPTEQRLEPKTDSKTNCLTSVAKDNLLLKYNIPVFDIETQTNLTPQYTLRRLTPLECQRLQTVPSWYKWIVSDSQIYKMLGNGWTVEAIKHILKYLKLNNE